MSIPKTAIEYLKSERAKQTVPYQKFYDEAIAALEKVNAFQNGNSCGMGKGTTVSLPCKLGDNRQTPCRYSNATAKNICAAGRFLYQRRKWYT